VTAPRPGSARVGLRGLAAIVAAVAFGLFTGIPVPVRTVAAVALVAVDDSASTTHDTPLSVAKPGVLANDVVLLGTTAVLDSPPAHGNVALAKDGSYKYTPKAGYVGADSFTYHDTDLLPSNTATVRITVTNALPVVAPDTYVATTGKELKVGPPGVLGNDSDVDGDHLTASLVDGSGNGSLSLKADGGFTFKSGGSFSGPRTFTYRVTDGLGWSTTVTVTIDVRPVGGPSPTPVPTATPTPRPTPTPTPRPTLPLPTLPLPSLPLPSLPLPTLPLPTLLPTPAPTHAPTSPPTTSPAPTPTLAPGSSSVPTARPTGTAGGAPASSVPAAPTPATSPSVAPTPAGPAGGGTTTGGGPGSGGQQPPTDQGLVVGKVQAPPIDDLVDVNVVGLDGLIEWAVPSLALGVPGLLLILAVLAQAIVGTLWLPVIRRWLGTFGVRRRRTRPARP
jgi:hypothetical protein